MGLGGMDWDVIMFVMCDVRLRTFDKRLDGHVRIWLSDSPSHSAVWHRKEVVVFHVVFWCIDVKFRHKYTF